MNPALLQAAAKLGIAGLAIVGLLWVIQMQDARAREDRVYNTQKVLEALADVENACKARK